MTVQKIHTQYEYETAEKLDRLWSKYIAADAVAYYADYRDEAKCNDADKAYATYNNALWDAQNIETRQLDEMEQQQQETCDSFLVDTGRF